MGFGLLCVGYLCLMLFRVIPIEPIGFYLITLACDKLTAHDRSFRHVRTAAGFMFFESLVGAFLWIDGIVGILPSGALSERINTVENAVYHIGLAVFHLLLCMAVASISRSVGYDGGKRNSRICFVATVIFYIGELLTFVPSLRAFLPLPLALFQLIWYVLSILMLVGCYRMIVTDEMLEREEKKYNEFLNKYGKKRTVENKPSLETKKKYKAKHK